MRHLVPGPVLTDILEPYRSVDRSRPAGPCWVLANMVGGLDGTAAVAGRVGGLSGSTDAELFRRLRTVAAVVLVGASTVRAERYGPVRLPAALRAEREAAGRPPVPRLAVVSASLDLDLGLPLFRDADPAARSLVVVPEDAPAD